MDTKPFGVRVRAWAVYICKCLRDLCVYRTQKANANVNTNERKPFTIFFCTNSNDKTVTASLLSPSKLVSCAPFVCHLLLTMSLWNFALAHTHKNLERYKLKRNVEHGMTTKTSPSTTSIKCDEPILAYLHPACSWSSFAFHKPTTFRLLIERNTPLQQQQQHLSNVLRNRLFLCTWTTSN